VERTGIPNSVTVAALIVAAALVSLDTAAQTERTTTYAYDPAGRLVRAEHGTAGHESFAWNRAGGMTASSAETGGVSLHVVAGPAGGGTVAGTGIDCPGDCTRTASGPFTVTLTATPASGWRFAGWTGAASGTASTATIDVTRDTTVGAYFARTDGATDGDDVEDTLEMGPDGDDPSWDGNGNGVPDYLEDRVVSFPSYRGGRYLTVEAPPGIVLSHAAAVDNPSPSDAPVDLFPLGFLELTFSGMSPGACFTANLFMPDDPELVDYWKYGPTASDTTDHWWRFDFEKGHGARLHHDGDRMRIALAYCDGRDGDADLTANGVVVDPGGPAVTGAGELVVDPSTPLSIYHSNYNAYLFPVTPVGEHAEFSVRIVNIGHGRVETGNVRFLHEPGSNEPSISRVENSCEWTSLGPGDACSIRLRYEPTDGPAEHFTHLYVWDRDPYQPHTLIDMPIYGHSTTDAAPDPVDASFFVEGQGHILSASGDVDCADDCTIALDASAFPEEFTAVPAPGWRFRHWLWRWMSFAGLTVEYESRAGAAIENPFTVRSSAGFLQFDDIAGDDPTSPPALVAVFEEIPEEHTLTVARTGAGRGEVVGTSVGLSCGTDCSVPVPDGESVTLTPSPFPGSVFTGFSGGGCSGTGPCTVTVTASITVTAEFEPSPAPQAELTVTLDGLGTGTVTSNPAGIGCPSDCSTTLTPGTHVRLEAVPAPGDRFTGWILEGIAVAGAGPLELTVETDTAVIARFEPQARADATLTVRSCGPGSGTVLSAPGGIACAPECSARFPAGDTVILIADPGSGATFGGWSWSGCPGAGPCTLTLDGDTTIAAGFGDGSAVRGDVTGDDDVTADDDLAVLAWLFTDPVPPGDPPDASWDCRTDAADLAFVVANRTAKRADQPPAWQWLELPDLLATGGASGSDGASGGPATDSGRDAEDGGAKAPPIPVLSGTGAALLVLLLLGGGIAVLRRTA